MDAKSKGGMFLRVHHLTADSQVSVQFMERSSEAVEGRTNSCSSCHCSSNELLAVAKKLEDQSCRK